MGWKAQLQKTDSRVAGGGKHSCRGCTVVEWQGVEAQLQRVDSRVAGGGKHSCTGFTTEWQGVESTVAEGGKPSYRK